jgi:hypothetical protein
MPFWQLASQEGSLAGTSTRSQQQQQQATAATERSLAGTAADAQQQVLELPRMQRSFYGGNSSISLQDNIIALDPNGCYDGSSTLAWDSHSLLLALQGSAAGAAGSTRSVLVFTDIAFDPLHFTQLQAAPIPSVNVSGCSSSPASINLNRLAQAVTLQQGALMVLGGGLRLLQAAPLDAVSSSSGVDTAALLLLGSVDVSAGAELLLQDVVVAVSDSSSTQQAMQRVAQQHGGSSSAPSLQELSAAEAAAAAAGVSGSSGPTVLVNSWSVDLSGFELHEGAAAAAQGELYFGLQPAAEAVVATAAAAAASVAAVAGAKKPSSD